MGRQRGKESSERAAKAKVKAIKACTRLMEEIQPNGSHWPRGDEDWAAEEHAGAVYDEDDEMIAAFCGCVDCPDL